MYINNLWALQCIMSIDKFYSFSIIQTIGKTPWAGDQPAARPLPMQDNQTDFHASSGIRTYDPSVWAGENDLRLRPRGHSDQPGEVIRVLN
jgi:hypothetical protein